MSRVLRIVMWVVAVGVGVAWVAVAGVPYYTFGESGPILEDREVVAQTRQLTWLLGPIFWLLLAFAADWVLPRVRVYLCAVVTGILLWCAFFPLNLGPVAFVALVPFLVLVRCDGISHGRRYLAAWVGGLTFASLAMSWVRVAHPMMTYFAWPGMTLFLSLFFPLALLLLRRLDRLNQPPLAVTLPVVWVALEYFRAHFPTGYPFLKWVGLQHLSGFSWYFLGHTQHEFLPLIQVADVTGVYGVSVAVAAVNGAAYDFAMRVRPVRWLAGLTIAWRQPTYYREMVAGAIAAAALLLPVGYGTFRLIHKPFATGPRVVLLQNDIDQPTMQTSSIKLFNEYDRMCEAAGRNSPDLIVWPEACYPYADVELTNDADPFLLPKPYDFELAMQDANIDVTRLPQDFTADPENRRLIELFRLGRQKYAAKTWQTNVLLGTNGADFDGTTLRRYNSAKLLYGDGSPGPRYDKMHLVPFGEYVPFRDSIDWLKVFTPNPDEPGCRPGRDHTRFDILSRKKGPNGEFTSYRFGVLICYEDTEPLLARQFNPLSGQAKPVDFLVNISHDGWFDGTEEHEQHLAIARFRAVEARRTLVRAVNYGISAVVDPDGKVTRTPEPTWGESKGIRAVVTEDVPVDDRGSLYAAVGDWVPLLVWLLLVGGLLTGRLKGRQK